MRVFLRAFEPDDHLQTFRWRNDSRNWEATTGNVVFVSSEREREWVREKSLPDDRNQYLAICLVETDEMIGYLSIQNIDWRNRHATWGGIVIGDPELWGSGYATEAARLLLRFVFFEMGMHRFYGHWLEGHASSIRMAEKLGFKKEGVLRESVFKNNRFQSEVVMSLLKPEYEAALAKEEN